LSDISLTVATNEIALTVEPSIEVKIDVAAGLPGPEGPPGPTGVVAAPLPLSYNDATRTITIAVGSGPNTVCAGNDPRLNPKINFFDTDLTFDGVELFKEVDVSASIDDSTHAKFDLLDNANEFETLAYKITRPTTSTVKITTEIPLAAGSYRLLGFEKAQEA
jgi:hypothetical protein